MNTGDNGANGELEKVRAILKRADKPQKGDIEEARRLLHKNPLPFGEFLYLTKIAESAYLKFVAEDSPLTLEIIKAEMQAKREELGIATASPLERLLIEEVVLCLVHLDFAYRNYVTVLKQSGSIEQGAWREKRLSIVQRRYLRAVETLAKVRRLKLPNVQLNIATDGGKQQNIQT